MRQSLRWVALCMAGAALLAPGCQNGLEPKGGDTADRRDEIPSPIDRMLPHAIQFHPFTEAGVRTFDGSGGLRGIETRIRATDASDDATKAFGRFRVELYAYRENAIDHRGAKGPTWDIDLSDPVVNDRHWDEISRSYKFLLQWDTAIPVGQRYVLRAVFLSPFTEILDTHKVYVSGE